MEKWVDAMIQRLPFRSLIFWPWGAGLGFVRRQSNLFTRFMKQEDPIAGFEGYSRFKPLARWQAAHGKLLQEDARYRKRFHFYLATIFCISGLLLPFYLPFFGIRLFGPVMNISIALGLAVVIVALTLRQFQYQKQCIGGYLRSLPSGTAS